MPICRAPGLACGVLHEVAAAAHGDRPAAFGFVFALTAAALAARAGPRRVRRLAAGARGLRRALRPRPRPARPRCRPAAPGRDPHRQGRAVGARGDAAIGGPAGHGRRRGRRRPRSHHQPPAEPRRRRARHAARPAAHLHRRAGTSAAATRWRIAAAPRRATASAPSRDPRWSVALERCRNGRPGQWLIEWDHVAHRFRLVEGVADRAPVARAGLRRAG